jgi:RNA polymerase sigma-70 factor, ECF subfamily
MVGLSHPAFAMERDDQPLAAGEAEALLVADAQRDPAAFARLYEIYYDDVYRYCYHRLRSVQAAEDAASVIFTNALAALPRFRLNPRAGSFRSWLFVIAHNVVANQQRGRERWHVVPLADAEAVQDRELSPEDAAMASEARQTIHDVLGRLTEEQRQVVELRLSGLSDAEIGRVLGRRQGAIRAAQFRAVARLRAILVPGRGEGGASDA